MKAMLLDAGWKPREGYHPNKSELENQNPSPFVCRATADAILARMNRCAALAGRAQ